MEYAPEIPNLPIIAKVIINGLKSLPESENSERNAYFDYCVFCIYWTLKII